MKNKKTPTGKFGKSITRARKRLKWSRGDLSAAADVKEKTVLNIERGAKYSGDVEQRIAKALKDAGVELKTP